MDVLYHFVICLEGGVEMYRDRTNRQKNTHLSLEVGWRMNMEMMGGYDLF
jgi:hypothetical protein